MLGELAHEIAHVGKRVGLEFHQIKAAGQRLNLAQLVADDRRTECKVTQPRQFAAWVFLFDGGADHFDRATIHVFHVLFLNAVGGSFTGGFEFIEHEQDVFDAELLEIGVGPLTKACDQSGVFKQLLVRMFFLQFELGTEFRAVKSSDLQPVGSLAGDGQVDGIIELAGGKGHERLV